MNCEIKCVGRGLLRGVRTVVEGGAAGGVVEGFSEVELW